MQELSKPQSSAKHPRKYNASLEEEKKEHAKESKQDGEKNEAEWEKFKIEPSNKQSAKKA